jgi:NADH-quinone oxidoreductase subunit E
LQLNAPFVVRRALNTCILFQKPTIRSVIWPWQLWQLKELLIKCARVVVDPELEERFEERFVELIDHYRGQQGALVPLLQGAQAIFGYLPPEVMSRVADACGEPLSRAMGVATFYSQFRLKPHAKHTIRCCHGTACHVSGASLISDELQKYLGIDAGENTEDMLYTVENVYCVGACGMAPVVMINDRAYGKLTPAKAVQVLRDFQAAEGGGAEPSGNGSGGKAAGDDQEDAGDSPESDGEDA